MSDLFYKDASLGASDTPERRISRALEIATQFAQIDGAHHKMYAIDQMVRALTGCPTDILSSVDYMGEQYEYEAQIANDEYNEYVRYYEGEVIVESDGTRYTDYVWETGIPG